MDFLSNLSKGGGGSDDSKKPAGVEKSSSGDLVANAKVVAEAAKCQFGNEPTKYDKSKAAGAAAELIDAAEKYAKLDETQGVGKYAEQAEGYLRSYSGNKPAAHAAGEDKPAAGAAHPTGEDKPAPAAEKSESEGGYGDLMKAAGGFFKK